MKNSKIMYLAVFLCLIFLKKENVYAEKFFDSNYENLEGYFGSIQNQNLFMDLSCKFSILFEEVGSVNVFYSIESGYYFEVKGYKKGITVVQNLKVNPQDVVNESYSYINFEDLNIDYENEEYCYEPIFPPGSLCEPNLGCTYIPYDPGCLVFICGIKTSIGGLPYCIVT